MSTTEDSFLRKLDKLAPSSLNQFDAFPKLPSTYKTRSESRGFLTIFVAFLSLLLILNDVVEWVWGWPEYQFDVDHDRASFMTVNIDVLVNMPCQYLTVDLRDVLGDRLFLSKGFSRDGTFFDIGQATTLKAHSAALSAREVVAQSRKSQGFFSFLRWSRRPTFRPTYNYKPDGSACRVYGSLDVKKVSGNLHITTLGHGYASPYHVDHSHMNLSHVINEFSFGPYFPDITQPLDHSFEVAVDPFVAYQYYLSIVPTTYIAPRSAPLKTNQYSVTHYTRVLDHHQGTPGIFFKFDLEPVGMTIRQHTTTFLQFIIRCVGVIGGIWCCMNWTVRFGYKAMDVVSGADKTPGIVAAEATGVKRKWGGGEIRSRVTRQGNGWAVDSDSPYNSQWNTPATATFPSPGLSTPNSPYTNGSANNSYGLGISPPAFGPRPSYGNQRPSSSGVINAAGIPLPPTPNAPPSASTFSIPPTPSATYPASPSGQPGTSTPSLNGSAGLLPQSSQAGPPRHIRTESKKDD